jgi:predicted Zn-dependent protease
VGYALPHMHKDIPGAPRRRYAIWLAAGFFLLASAPAFGHAPPPDQIVVLTVQIAKYPTNALLYLERSDLHRIHSDWKAALTDCRRALRLDSGLAEVDLYRAKTLRDAGRVKQSKRLLDRFLAKKPRHAEGLVTRARVLVKLHRHMDASRDFTTAISELADPLPEHYMERSQALVAAGGEHVDVALRGLDEGLRRLGQPVSLQLYAIELELLSERYDAALSRLTHIAAQSPNKAVWLAQRGDILTQAGRVCSARIAFHDALVFLEELPPPRRVAPAMTKLRVRIHTALNSLEVQTPCGEHSP